jgi:hypothetical protein
MTVSYFVSHLESFRRPSEPHVKQQLDDSGKGIELFQKRQERMSKFTVDDQNRINNVDRKSRRK